MNSNISGVDDADLVLLVGCNPKKENPVLNARIGKAVRLNGLDVASIGPGNNLAYDYQHLGNSTKTL